MSDYPQGNSKHSSAPQSSIPDIPGALVTDPDITSYLSFRVSQLCGLSSTKFPGSQPVSFTRKSLKMLEEKDFWVCEKSDGVRVLVMIVINTIENRQDVFLIDRKQRYFQLSGLYFPHWENPDYPQADTILDGELVIDFDPEASEKGVGTLRLYAFDCLVLNGENIMQKSLHSRFGRLKSWVVEPWSKAVRTNPGWKTKVPFDVVAKPQELAYHIAQVVDYHIPRLQHGHDGLIFTCAESSYVPGTDEKILKWKPPSENSVDFKLQLVFPPTPGRPNERDQDAKPDIYAYVWQGGDEYQFYDVLDIDDEEWAEMRATGKDYQGQIVEVCWDAKRFTWKIMRIRDDKPHGNHASIVTKILQSILDGVELDELLAETNSIRAAWKARAEVHSHVQPQIVGQKRSAAQDSPAPRPPPRPEATVHRPPPPPNRRPSGPPRGGGLALRR